jgi:hypothetical protein
MRTVRLVSVAPSPLRQARAAAWWRGACLPLIFPLSSSPRTRGPSYSKSRLGSRVRGNDEGWRERASKNSVLHAPSCIRETIRFLFSLKEKRIMDLTPFTLPGLARPCRGGSHPDRHHPSQGDPAGAGAETPQPSTVSTCQLHLLALTAQVEKWSPDQPRARTCQDSNVTERY